MIPEILNIQDQIFMPTIERKEVYCELDFLERLWNNFDFSKYKNSKDYLFWSNLYSFLVHSKLILDITKDELQNFRISKQENIVKKLLERTESKGCTLKARGKWKLQDFFPQDINLFEKQELLTGIFLTTIPEEECVVIEKMYGVQVISYERIINDKMSPNFFNLYVQSIENKELEDVSDPENWQFLKVYQHCCNAILIIDPYLFLQPNWKDNVVPLLKNFLPKQPLDIPIDITFFAGDCKFDQQTNKKLMINLGPIAQELKVLVKNEIGVGYKTKINVCAIRNLYHDRLLVTNYMYMSIGYGFDFVTQNKIFRKKRTTAIGFYPASIQNSVGAVNEYKNLIFDLKEKTSNLDWKGGNGNRLLD